MKIFKRASPAYGGTKNTSGIGGALHGHSPGAHNGFQWNVPSIDG